MKLIDVITLYPSFPIIAPGLVRASVMGNVIPLKPTHYSQRGLTVHNEFTAFIEKDEEWFIAYCPEIPGANGQGQTQDEAKQSLSEAIELILEDRREDGLRGVPKDAIKEIVTIG